MLAADSMLARAATALRRRPKSQQTTFPLIALHLLICLSHPWAKVCVLQSSVQSFSLKAEGNVPPVEVVSVTASVCGSGTSWLSPVPT